MSLFGSKPCSATAFRKPKSVSEPNRLTPKVLPRRSCGVAMSGVVTRLIGITLMVVPITVRSEPDKRDSAAAAPDPCTICADPRRDRSMICVVEEPTDVLAVEKTNDFQGLYHVLGGVINPLDGIGPEELKGRAVVLYFSFDRDALGPVPVVNQIRWGRIGEPVN